MQHTVMKKSFYVLAVLSLIAVMATVYLAASTKTIIVAKASPAKSWRIEILGSPQLLGGIEVTANVYTQQNQHMLGVINLCSSWEEAKFIYAESATDKLMIDEVKATFDGRMLIRDRYLPNENHGVTGSVGGIPIKLPIGELTNTGFKFSDGTSEGSSSHVTVMPKNLPTEIQPGFEIHIKSVDPIPQAAFVNVTIRGRNDDLQQSLSLSGRCDLAINITEVTDHIVEGTISISSEEDDVKLDGNFRLVNHLRDHPDIPLKTKLVN